jgi:hypothetical protein
MRVQATAGGQSETRAAYTVSVEDRLVLVKFGRQVSVRKIEQYVAALCCDPSFGASFSEIIDLGDVEDLQVNPEEALALADLVDPFKAGSKRAFVARTEVQVHAARMHQILRNDEENIRIFSSIEEATSWIRS